MTSSRYHNNIMFDRIICMTPQEYLIFKGNLETGCTFTINTLSYKQRFQICLFNARWYEVDNIQHFHVTNDTRRRICKFLSELT
jgi:hypothetical protein